MSLAERGQVKASAAEFYDSRFVPALFSQFASRLVTFAGTMPGTRVLDVATGTGIVALAAANVGATATGLDINAEMLRVAQRKSKEVDWVEGDVLALPFHDTAFRTVFCQFAMMFFSNRDKALSEMLRVLKPNGRLALAVFKSLEDTPAYSELISLLGQIVGPEASDALSAPFVLGDIGKVTGRIEAVGATVEKVEAVAGTAHHPSLNAWLDTEVGGWTMSEMVSTSQLKTLKTEARRLFDPYVKTDGTITFSAPAYFIAARR